MSTTPHHTPAVDDSVILRYDCIDPRESPRSSPQPRTPAQEPALASLLYVNLNPLASACLRICPRGPQASKNCGRSGPNESSLGLRYPDSGAVIVQIQTPETRVAAQELNANLDFLRPDFTGPRDPASSAGVTALNKKLAAGLDPLPQGADLRSRRADV